MTAPTRDPTPRQLLTAGEAGTVLGVDRQTVVRWAKDGDLRCVTTPGGHHRFRQSDVALLLASGVAGRGSGNRPARRYQLRVLRAVPVTARDTRRLERAAQLLAAVESVSLALGVQPEVWEETTNLPRTCWDVTRK